MKNGDVKINLQKISQEYIKLYIYNRLFRVPV